MKKNNKHSHLLSERVSDNQQSEELILRLAILEFKQIDAHNDNEKIFHDCINIANNLVHHN